ncbi:MAG TPA: outer membrane protein [Blastocatellia bacterium]
MKLVAVAGGVTLTLLTSLSAHAADMTPVVQPAPSSYIPAKFLWSGFYLGGALGYAWGSATFTDPFAAATGSPSLKGFLVGGLIGVNYQFDTWVVGFEGDFTGTWANGSVVDAAGNNLQTRVFWTSTLTGRIGVALDRLLIYGKGGAAFAYDRDTVTVAPSRVGADGSTYRAGWTFGGGLEYAITEHWIARVEYDYLKFSSTNFVFTDGRPVLLGGITGGGNVSFTLNEAKAAMAYKF